MYVLNNLHSDIFTCVIVKTHEHEPEQQGLELLVVCREDYRRRQVYECVGMV